MGVGGSGVADVGVGGVGEGGVAYVGVGGAGDGGGDMDVGGAGDGGVADVGVSGESTLPKDTGRFLCLQDRRKRQPLLLHLDCSSLK